jgi:hypothetical protein
MPERKANNNSKFMLRMMGLPWKFRHHSRRQQQITGKGNHRKCSK